MLSKILLANRLKRFELLTGINYPEGERVIEIWQSQLKDFSEERFNKVCDTIEIKKLKWHILPTTTDFFSELQPQTRKP